VRRNIKEVEITRETDYAIRTVLYLSKMADYKAFSAEISQNMQIPKSFLRKIAKKLEKAKIVQLVRGVKGGIRLIKSPREITLYDVILATENQISLNRCLVNKQICGLHQYCPVHPVWIKIRNKLIDALREINFAELSREGATS